MEFQPFAKIPRLFRPVVITEKIDGTNASVLIQQWMNPPGDMEREGAELCVYSEKLSRFYGVLAGSRTRWITPESDNFGFAKWVERHALELVEGLGEGHHFGEWWGVGIQRGYDLSERRFSLFNASKWTSPMNTDGDHLTQCLEVPCCHVVPVLRRSPVFSTEEVGDVMQDLSEAGSWAALGYRNPEGVVVYHAAGNLLFKATLDNDGTPKGKVSA